MTEPVIDEATFRELQDTAGTEFVAELVPDGTTVRGVISSSCSATRKMVWFAPTCMNSPYEAWSQRGRSSNHLCRR